MMIEVIYDRRQHRLIVQGHAQSGESGHDLVCASASILAYSLAASIANAEERGTVTEVYTYFDKGEAEIRCKPARKMDSVVRLMYSTICAGYELLSRQYPDNIHYDVVG